MCDWRLTSEETSARLLATRWFISERKSSARSRAARTAASARSFSTRRRSFSIADRRAEEDEKIVADGLRNEIRRTRLERRDRHVHFRRARHIDDGKRDPGGGEFREEIQPRAAAEVMIEREHVDVPQRDPRHGVRGRADVNHIEPRPAKRPLHEPAQRFVVVEVEDTTYGVAHRLTRSRGSG